MTAPSGGVPRAVSCCQSVVPGATEADGVTPRYLPAASYHVSPSRLVPVRSVPFAHAVASYVRPGTSTCTGGVHADGQPVASPSDCEMRSEATPLWATVGSS